MNTIGIYYKDQCNYCLNKGKCGYEKRTKQFIETISGIESLANGVFGCLSFAHFGGSKVCPKMKENAYERGD